MIKRVVLDTNVILRFLVTDQPQQAAKAGALFAAADKGEVRLVILREVLTEVVFVLESFYKKTRGDIEAALAVMVASSAVELHERETALDGLRRYAAGNLHIVDAMVAAKAADEGWDLASFDKALLRQNGIKPYGF